MHQNDFFANRLVTICAIHFQQKNLKVPKQSCFKISDWNFRAQQQSLGKSLVKKSQRQPKVAFTGTFFSFTEKTIRNKPYACSYLRIRVQKGQLSKQTLVIVLLEKPSRLSAMHHIFLPKVTRIDNNFKFMTQIVVFLIL